MKRTKKPKQESRGLGDTIEKFTKATGIKKIVEWISGEDCGCDERKEKLNRLFRYNKPECLEENEHIYLKEFFDNHRGSIKPLEQTELLKIYNRIFKTRKEKSTCSSCVRSMIGELHIVYKTYGSK